MNNFLLSIIIPTRNREKYCLAAINQIASILSSEMQLVIQDNSDLNTLEKNIHFQENIIYNYHPGKISFIDNFNEALLLASGEYICMIGDDDGILPNILEVVKFAKEKEVDTIVPGLNAVYCWPTDKPFIKHAENGYMCLSYVKKGYSEIDKELCLKNLLKNGGQQYQKLGLPRLYHGIVNKKTLDKIHEKTGTYFGGLTPDIYMAVALCLVENKVLRLNFPVTISGICPNSGSSDSATGKHTGQLKDAPHFKGHNNYIWDTKIPEIYSVESIWAETVLKALKNFGREDLSRQFRVDVLDGICLAKYPQFKDKIYASIKLNNVCRLRLIWQKNKYKIFPNIKRIARRIFRKKNSVKKYYKVENIEAAVKIAMNEINAL